MTSGTNDRHKEPTSRIQSLADAVFAIAMTILVLGIEVPDIPEGSSSDVLARELLALWPDMHVYIVSFLILGVFWVIHNTQFRLITEGDRVLQWINLVTLMVVALVPFSTELFGNYHSERLAIIVYAINIAVLALMLYLHWWYAIKYCKMSEDVTPRLITVINLEMLVTPAVCVFAVTASFFQAEYVKFIFLLIPLIYFIIRLIGYRRRNLASAR